MDLKIIEEIPPWEWPEGTNKFFLDILRNNQAEETDRLLAAELAGGHCYWIPRTEQLGGNLFRLGF